MNASRIEIVGGIASGKTTLALVLGESGFIPILEDFRRSPFWEAFYAEPGTHAFETELSFLLLHYHQAKLAPRLSACDFSFLLDEAYADISLAGSQLETFKKVLDEVRRETVPPSVYVYLECSPQAELMRIQTRGRHEETQIDLQFLSRLNSAILHRIGDSLIPTVRINSEQIDFRNGPGQDEVVRAIRESLAI